jgi:hypothetical protein
MLLLLALADLSPECFPGKLLECLLCRGHLGGVPHEEAQDMLLEDGRGDQRD